MGNMSFSERLLWKGGGGTIALDSQANTTKAQCRLAINGLKRRL
jgi:hypothetical protein